MKHPLKILVCPLDWGIGHASRMIPVICQLMLEGHEITIAAGGRSLDLLKSEFPGLNSVFLPSKPVTYLKKKIRSIKLLSQVPGILLDIYKEHRWLKRYILTHPVDLILSDNRYGLWTKSVPSVFITHQVFPLLPKPFAWFEPVVHALFRRLITRFDRCWIPDTGDPEKNLTGILSHHDPMPNNTRYIGILSRFSRTVPSSADNFSSLKYDIVVIISGPEPQRSVFEKIMLGQLENCGHRSAIIRGIPKSGLGNDPGIAANIDLYDHLPADRFRDIMKHAGVIICRAGYSTIMDLIELNRRAILIPTPGQPEQEYLAVYLGHQGYFTTADQSDFDLKNALQLYRENKKRDLPFPKTNIKHFLPDIMKLHHDHQKNCNHPQQKPRIDLAG